MKNWKKVFGIIWAGQLISTLSSAVVGYAVVFWLSIKTGSAEVLAFSIIASLLPQLLLGIFTGVLIDRWDRKKVMIFADAFIAICTLIVCILFYLGEVKITYIYVLLALRSVGSAFHIPAMQASIPLLVPQTELLRISGIGQMMQSISTIAGPALAGIMISLLDMTYVLLTDVAGAVIAIVSLLFVYIPNPEKKEEHHTPDVIREMKEGLEAIYSNEGLFWMFVFVVLAYFFIMPISALFPLLTIRHFFGGTYQMSIVEVGWGIGLLLGGAILGLKKYMLNEVVLINISYIVVGLTFALSGVLPITGFWIFVWLTFIAGISWSMYCGAFNVILQKEIESAALGRVFSIYGSVTLLPSMIGLLETGLIADNIGITSVFIISGIALVIIGVVSFMVPSVKLMIRAGNTK